MRLPRKNSMTHRADFARVKKTGHAKAGRFVILSTLPDPQLDAIRTGFITSKRAAKKAHDRVLLRRRFRALVQEHAPRFLEIRRYLVVIARPGAAEASFDELAEDWLRQARRLGLFPTPHRNILIAKAATACIRLGIRFYQRFLSPLLKVAAGPAAGCRFSPTCSHYFLQAVETHGPLRGSWIGICRIFRCHPWGGCGYDPVPSARNPQTASSPCSCHSTDKPH